jgi:hypothetical protein
LLAKNGPPVCADNASIWACPRSGLAPVAATGLCPTALWPSPEGLFGTGVSDRATFSSRTSRSSSLNHWPSSVVKPARLPAWRSAWRTQCRSVSVVDVGLVSSAGPLSAERRAHRSRRHWPGLKPTSRLNTRVK